MQLNGQYADLFTLQAAAYQSNGVAAEASERIGAVP